MEIGKIHLCLLLQEALFKTSDLIVIDEAGLGYRKFQPTLKNKKVILKMSYPFCEGELWNKLIVKGNDLITIVNLSNLRKYDIKVSSGISWEQTALDLAFELTNNFRLKELLKSSHVIVNIGSAGALYIKNGSDETKAEFQLIFDPKNMEGEWEIENGTSIGLGSAFTAGFTRKFIESRFEFYKKKENKSKSFTPKIEDLIKAGLNLCESCFKRRIVML